MELLKDIKSWNKANNNDIHCVISLLLEHQLKDHFSFIELRQYSCNGVKNKVARFRHIQTNMVFHLIPGGYLHAGISLFQQWIIEKLYKMDAPEYYLSEGSPPKIDIAPFLISEYLITEYAWAKFGGKNLYRSFGSEYPIDGVKYNDVSKWCSKANLIIPTELQWEYACKAGSNSIFYWGNLPNYSYAWTKKNRYFDIEKSKSKNTEIINHTNSNTISSIKKQFGYIVENISAPLNFSNKLTNKNYHTYTAKEQKRPNAFGLLGMIGNLGEYVTELLQPYSGGCDTSIYSIPFWKGENILRGGWHEYGWKYNRTNSRIHSAVSDTGCSSRAVFPLELKTIEQIITKLDESSDNKTLS